MDFGVQRDPEAEAKAQAELIPKLNEVIAKHELSRDAVTRILKDLILKAQD